MYLVWSFLIVAIEGSSRYAAATVIIVIGVLLMTYATVLPGVGSKRLVELWAAGHEVDRAKVLDAMYAWTRQAVVRTVAVQVVWASLSAVIIAAMAGASWSRVAQYGILGAAAGAAVGRASAPAVTPAAAITRRRRRGAIRRARL
jgi:hypothetical protein